MYVAVRGGEQAIQNAEALYHALKNPPTREMVQAIERTMPYLVDRVMGEGSLYAPELAALALAQTGGDLYEAVLILRAFRSTQPRLAYAEPVSTQTLFTVRRISAAFKDIPGGQVLGPTLDYSHRILQLEVLDGNPPASNVPPRGNSEQGAQPESPSPEAQPAPQGTPTYPLVADWHRLTGLMPPLAQRTQLRPEEVPDVTREPLLFPAPRAERLQSFSRADTGGILALGYANMRGYGLIHPTINELRLGYAGVQLRHPITGDVYSLGRVRVSQAEIISNVPSAAQTPGNDPHAHLNKQEFGLGFAATLGWNEVKVIAASMLDMAMDAPQPHPAHTEEFVLYHTDPVEASGFCIHYKLPHYVTFASGLDAMRSANALADAAAAQEQEPEASQAKKEEAHA
jgi:alpha-D-ribose 1-methylphosphonate 5-triphosphate synthase subunit PhnI